MRNKKVDRKLDSIRQAVASSDVTVSGIAISVLPNVYPTSELAGLVVECMDDPNHGIRNGDHVLDCGTGTGFLAVQAALLSITHKLGHSNLRLGG